MDYELAKQLKDAGFPQPETPEIGREYLDEDGGTHIFSQKEWDATNMPVLTNEKNRRERKRLLSEYNNGCLIPTLEELIEACGETFAFLAKADDGSEWKAVDFVYVERKQREGIGSTPIEAVARSSTTSRKGRMPKGSLANY